MKIMASSPITSWQIDGETMETVADYFWGYKITADGDCSHEVKRLLLLGRKVMISLDSIFGEGNGTPLQHSCLENPMDGGAWWAAVHGVSKSRTRLSDFTFTFHFHALEKEMATHSRVLAWRIPGTGGASWAAVHGVVQSWTRLQKLSSRQHIKKQRHYFAKKGPSSQNYGLSSSHVWT